MANDSLASPPPNTMWMQQEDHYAGEIDEPRRSFLSEHTRRSDGPRRSFLTEHTRRSDASVITLPVPGTSTLMSARFSAASSLDMGRKIESASPETAKHVALRMYKSLKTHGLRSEARGAFTREVEGDVISDVEAIKNEGDEGGRRKSAELLGMEYLLKDGFVSYLRDMAKITPPIPQQVVRFYGIKYSKNCEISSGGYATFGNKLMGCFLGPIKTILKEKGLTRMQILKGVDGCIMPGSMTLLLGPPGSGKSTLLEILAGKAKVTPNSRLGGSVMYNDKSVTEVCHSRFIAYVNGQLNKHIPFLSVRETLEFARDCTQGLRPENFTPQMRKFFAHALVEGQDPFLEYVLAILGLKEVEHKLTGEGFSDFDRQKLTTAELALGTYSVMIYDQPFSSSDLAATYDLVDTLRTMSRIQHSSAIVSLTQLSQEIFDLFDRVILLSDGHVLFQGTRQDAIPYFTKLGYIKPLHVESNEFLEDIAAGDGSKYMASGATSSTLEELVECYNTSDHYQDILRIVQGDEVKHTYWVDSELGLGLTLKTPSKYPYAVDGRPRKETELVVAKLSSKIGNSGGIESTGRVQVGDVVTAISINNDEMQYLSVGPQEILHERASHVYSMLKQARGHIRLQVERSKEEEDENQAQLKQFRRPFVQTWWESTQTLIKRQIKITKRLHAIIKLRLFQAIVLGLFVGSLYYDFGGKYNQRQMNSVRSLGFVSTMSIMLINLVQLPIYLLQRPIFYKHKAQRFYRVSSYVVAHCIVNLPQTLLEAIAYTVGAYFLAGLSLTGNGAPFFQYLLLLFLVAYFGSAVFFFLSAISSIPEVGNALAGLVVSIFLLFSGFPIYPSNVPVYWKWLVYANPIHWANVLYCKAQFENDYQDPCSGYQLQLAFCAQFPDMTVGKAYLEYYQLSEDAKNPWLPYVVLIGWTFIANFLGLLGLKKIEFTETSQSLPSIRSSPTISNYKKDMEREFQSLESHNEQTNSFEASQISGRQRDGNIRDNGRVEEWVEQFSIDMERNGLGISVEPITLLFDDLSFMRYGEDMKDGSSIFSNITGFARPRNMLALMGGSKGSKSTLLKCLAGRAPSVGSLKGSLQAKCWDKGAAYSRLTGYVEKLDAHQPYLSVRETLHFSAALRLSQTISSVNRRIHVELVLDQLDLLPYSNQLVGSLRDATGKTFEIAKKITIAVELAANPSILFLEEPISGLDSRGTSSILNILSQVSNSGRVIIATLAHPNARTLDFFDLALILTHEGQQAYFGPIGPDCGDLLDYFLSVSKVPRNSIRVSPVSFVMSTLGVGIKKRATPSINFAGAYQASSLHEMNNREINSINSLTEDRNSKVSSSVYPASYKLQALMVLLRTQRFLWRNVQYTYGRLTGCIVIGLLMGSLYWKIEYDDVYGLTSRSLYIYMQVILIGVISANNVIPQIGTDRLVYFREKRAGMYHPIFYPLSWALGEIPYFFIATLALVGIGNVMAGIATSSIHDFMIYWTVLFVFTICLTYFGMMITFLAPVPTLAAFAVSIVTSLWVSASGVVVMLLDIRFYRWMYWSNPLQYAIDVMTSISFYCNTKECVSDCSCQKLPDGSYAWDRLASLRSSSYDRIGTDMVILSAMSLLFACLAFLFFVVLKHNSPPQT
ncbi:hypothetical protein ACJRO7_030749 [Eucalyptus globulus]|uniref:ABC transporter domain-containing protein n=1 Tax=Eucalyptus globulus TaxID=34317 RepID=A0ABD3JI64_EUCGL